MCKLLRKLYVVEFVNKEMFLIVNNNVVFVCFFFLSTLFRVTRLPYRISNIHPFLIF